MQLKLRLDAEPQPREKSYGHQRLDPYRLVFDHTQLPVYTQRDIYSRRLSVVRLLVIGLAGFRSSLIGWILTVSW
jgi:hypothetical protein